MVKIALALALAYGPTARAESQFGFVTDCSKKEIFEGENVVCNFVIISSDEVVDVEVAKFPEFRGFWSENVALRQGPIPLLPSLMGDGARKAIVGTYSLMPMIGKENPSIEPMKVVVRRPMSSIDVALTVSSEPPELKIKPLPPVPATWKDLPYQGAVGNFSLIPEPREVFFQKDEPITFRFTIQGEGNFPEMNELAFNLPPHAEVLGKKAYSQGSGQYGTKTFEITAAIHSADDFTATPPPFLYFHPSSKRYESLPLPEITFRHVVRQAQSPEGERIPVQLDAPRAQWSFRRPLKRQPLFWAFHAICAMAALSLLSRQVFERRTRRKRHRPDFQRRVRAEVAFEAARLENIELFLRIADDLALEILREVTGAPKSLSHRRTLAWAQGKIDPDCLDHARRIFESAEKFQYHPVKEAPESLPSLMASLESLLSAKPLKKAA